MRKVVQPHPRGTSGSSTSTDGASPNRASVLSSISAAAAAATASTAAAAAVSLSLSTFPVSAATGATAVAVAAIAATSPTDQIFQRQSQERSYTAPTLQLDEGGLQQEGRHFPIRPYIL